MATKEEILINVTPRETRVAVVEDGVLQELHLERTLVRGIVGNIYKGKIVRVLPGMQAAFVDIGLDKNGFLHARDIVANTVSGAGKSLNGAEAGGALIQDLVREGESVYVQILKDPIADKGARLTTQLSIPSRNLVYLPYGSDIGISQKLDNPDERERLSEFLQCLKVEHELSGGFIIRTVAESASDEDIAADVLFLKRIWNLNTKLMQTASIASLVHEDLPLALRALRDLVHDDVKTIYIDSRETIEKVKEFSAELMPEAINKLNYYSGEKPLFGLYCVEQACQ